MQVKANRILALDEKSEVKEFVDVEVIKGTFGLYVEFTDIIGKDNEGKDLTQLKLQLFPWEKVLLLEWNEKTLVESVKEFVILTQLEDFADILEELEEDLGIDEASEEAAKEAKDTESNPYE
tara:strand:- start:842 stop:1207 length:366 start_codon:yes stop_codon:yes gene_type:complete